MMLSLTLGALAIAQITIVAQALDAMAIAALGKSYGIRYYPFFEVSQSTSSSLQPFGVNQSMVSVGFLVAMVICVALGLMDLTSNSLPQYISFALLACFVVFSGLHISPLAIESMDLNQSYTGMTSWFGNDPASIIGVAVFNYSIVIAIPSLLADTRTGVNFGGATSGAIWGVFTLYAFIGCIGAIVYAGITDNVIEPMLQAKTFHGTVASFAFVWAIIPPLPIYTILISRNLEQVSGRPVLSKFLGVFVPWLLALFLYMSEAFGSFLVWTSILVLGFTNYTIPLLIAASSKSAISTTAVDSKDEMPDTRSFMTVLRDNIRKAWADEIGRKALVLNVFTTSILILVICINVRSSYIA